MSRLTRKGNKYCCVPQCKNYLTDDVKMHLFPKNESMRKLWKHVLKIGKNITNTMCVCSAHFKKEDYVLGKYCKIFNNIFSSSDILLLRVQSCLDN